jgi:DNA-binding HxlR family transcriptional regulator
MKYFIKSFFSSLLILLFVLSTVKSETKKVKVFWGLLGSYPQEKKWNPYELTREDKKIDVASILYSIRRDYKTSDQISRETNISNKDIEHKLKELENCKLVREKENKFIVNFPFWDITLRDKITALGFELTDQIVEVLKIELPNLKTIFEKSMLPAQGYDWNDISLTVIGGLLVDTGLNDRGLRKWKIFDPKKDTPIRPGNYRYWYRAVENGWGDFWKFGHNMIKNDNFDIWFGLFYGQIPGKRMNWSKIWDVFDKSTRKIIFPLIEKGEIKRNELQREIKMTADSLNAILLKMEQAKIIRIDDSVVYPNFPVFQEKDIQNFLSKIDSLCNQIIDEIYIPFLPKIQQSWKEIAPSNWEMQKIEKFFIREVYSRPYNFTLDRLIREGMLPPSPIEPPFNYWGIKGHFKVL